MLSALLLLLAAQLPPPLARPAPALLVYPSPSDGLRGYGAGECTGASILGSRGEAITVTRASAQTCTKGDGTLVALTSNQPATTGAGVLVEPAGTNVRIYSSEQENVAVSKVGVTVSANDVLAPDGTTTADTLTTTTTGEAEINRTSTLAAGVNTFSVSVRPGTANFYLLTTGGLAQWASFNGSTCAALSTGGGATSSARTQANGFCRLAMTATTVANPTTVICVSNSQANAETCSGGAVGITGSVWGVQLEAGGVETSYCPTGAATCTRAATTGTVANPLAAAPANPTQWCIGGTYSPAVGAWANLPDGTGAVVSVGATYGAANSAHVFVGSNGKPGFHVFDSTPTLKNLTADSAISYGTHDIFGCVNNGVQSIWVDGALVKSGNSGAIVSTQPANAYLGGLGSSYFATGRVSNVRITRGVSP